jgi:hypothetical protein
LEGEFLQQRLEDGGEKVGRNGMSDVEGSDQTRELCGMLQVLQEISGCWVVAGKTNTKRASRTKVDKVQQAT